MILKTLIPNLRSIKDKLLSFSLPGILSINEGCDIFSFVYIIPRYFLHFFTTYPQFFLFLFTILSICRIYKLVNKLIEQKSGGLFKCIYEYKKGFIIFFWSFFIILLFILYYNEIPYLNNFLDIYTDFTKKDHRLAKSILGLTASSLALILILMKGKKERSLLTMVSVLLSVIWSLLFVYSNLFNESVVTDWIQWLINSSGLLIFLGFLVDYGYGNGYGYGHSMKVVDIREVHRKQLERIEKVRNFKPKPSTLRQETELVRGLKYPLNLPLYLHGPWLWPNQEASRLWLERPGLWLDNETSKRMEWDRAQRSFPLVTREWIDENWHWFPDLAKQYVKEAECWRDIPNNPNWSVNKVRNEERSGFWFIITR
jgi:hypothetical protein